MKDENSIYKGRCTSLARDIELHYNQMHRIKGDESAASEQTKILQERVRNLEDDFEQMRQQKNEAQLEVKKTI